MDTPPPTMPHVYEGMARKAMAGGNALPDASTLAATMALSAGQEPQTPAEYAFHILFSRFIALAERKMDMLLGKVVDMAEPQLPLYLGPNLDASFDSLLQSLAHIARRKSKVVIDSLLRWWKGQCNSPIDPGLVKRNMVESPSTNPAARFRDVATILSDRKSLVALYIVCRALIEVARALPVEALSGAHGVALEDTIFKELKSLSAEAVGGSANQQVCFDMLSLLLGELSKNRFITISDRFIADFEHSDLKTASKYGDPQTELMIRGMRHLHFKIYPLEAFEEAAEFAETLSRFYSAAHGYRIKSAFAETFIHLMLPVAKSATAEINHPTWMKTIETIYPKALAMSGKPRYWNIAFPLVCTLLAASPEEFFLDKWQTLIDASTTKFKDKASRAIALNCLCRLLWVYIYRCHETSSATTKTLEGFFKAVFPANRRLPSSPDASLELYTCMVYFVMQKHFEAGKELVMDFLHSSTLSGKSITLAFDHLSPERMTIAIRSILLTLGGFEREEAPAFPDSPNFSNFTVGPEYGWSSAELPDDFSFPQPKMRDAFAHFGDLIGKIALILDHHVVDITIFDERNVILRGSGTAALAADRAAIDKDGYLWRTHGAITVAYSKDHQPYFDLLRVCFEAWPRCLNPSISVQRILNVVFRSTFHADPAVGEAAAEALKRMARQRRGGTVVDGFMRHVFSTETVFWEEHSSQRLIMPKVESAVKLWVELLNTWLDELRSTSASDGGARKGEEMERTSAWAVLDEVEGHALMLLCSAWRPFRRSAVQILRLVGVLDDVLSSPGARLENKGQDEEEPRRIIHLLERPCNTFFTDEDEQRLNPLQKQRIRRWRRPDTVEPLLLLAETENSTDVSLWHQVLPTFLQTCCERFPTTIAMFRSTLTSRVIQMEPIVSVAAGIVQKAASTPLGTIAKLQTPSSYASVDQVLMAEHWKSYVLALCTTANTTDTAYTAPRTKSHSRKGSENSGITEQVVSPRELFQRLIPFLGSDVSRYRDAVVPAMGHISPSLYPILLESLQSVTRQLNDDFRNRQAQRATYRRSRRQDRLRTAVAQVHQLTSKFMSAPSSIGNSTVITLILYWVKETFNFLTDRDVRNDWEFQRLRKFFCGVVEELFNGLALLEESERFFSFDTRVRMFRLFREWHSYGQQMDDGQAKLQAMLIQAAEQYKDEKQKETTLQFLRSETQALSFSAASAMASLCQGAIAISQADPPPGNGNGNYVPPSMDIPTLFSWLGSLFANPSAQYHTVGRRALRALLVHNERQKGLLSQAVDHCFAEPERASVGRSFFAVLADVIVDKEDFAVPSHQALCLSLVKLGHPDTEVRRKALALLTATLERVSADVSVHEFEVSVCSALPGIYLRTQRQISAHLAAHHQHLKPSLICEYTLRIPQIDHARRATTLGLLPEWIEDVELLPDPKSEQLPFQTYLILSNLLFLTVKYGEAHSFEVQDIWSSLASEAHPMNGNAIIKFLIEQALRLRSPEFILHAKRVVSCLSQSAVGRRMFDELCGFIEPSSMIPIPREDPSQRVYNESPLLFLANLDDLLPPSSRRQVFSPGQLALLFVGELAYERTEQLHTHLAVLLHAILMQIDHFSTFVQDQIQAILQQLLLAVISTTPDVDGPEGRIQLRKRVTKLFSRGTTGFWSHDDMNAALEPTRTPKNMKLVITEILSVVHPYNSDLRQNWGKVALLWATSGPVRHMACRSFQAYRVLMPRVTPTMLADMLGRLSNTVSDPTEDIQSFALEILYTLAAVIRDVDASETEVLSQAFWATMACLSTSNEREFAEAINMVDGLLDKLDLGAVDIIQMLMVKRPEVWEGSRPAMQPLVLRGLRSSVTSAASLRVLSRFAVLSDSTLVDASLERLPLLFVASLPWFLHALEMGHIDESLAGLALDIARLADSEGRSDISRIATSVARSRFRTKDDFVRQAVACVTNNYMASLGPRIVVLLLSCVLNQTEWMRSTSMQLVKVVFHNVDMRTPEYADLGTELLMPLLRLLSTNLAAQALDVLDEPLVVSGGPTPAQILRMSVSGRLSKTRELLASGSVFGEPDDSGWCTPDPSAQMAVTRLNVQAVFKVCEATLDIAPMSSNVDFVMDDYYGDEPFTAIGAHVAPDAAETSSLGDMVSQLHDLSSFFGDDAVPTPNSMRYPHTELSAMYPHANTSHAQIAAILSRSVAPSIASDDVSSIGPSLASIPEERDRDRDVFFEAPSTPVDAMTTAHSSVISPQSSEGSSEEAGAFNLEPVRTPPRKFRLTMPRKVPRPPMPTTPSRHATSPSYDSQRNRGGG